jgi:hypothetical protein
MGRPLEEGELPVSADRMDTPPAPDTARLGADLNPVLPDAPPAGDEATPATDQAGGTPPAPDTARLGADLNPVLPDAPPAGDEATPATDARAREREEHDKADGVMSRLKHGALVFAASVNFGTADVAHSAAPWIDDMSVRAAQAVGTTEDAADQAVTIKDAAGNIFSVTSGGVHGDLNSAGHGAETAGHAVSEVRAEAPVIEAPQDPSGPDEPGPPAKDIETLLQIRGEQEKEQLEEAEAFRKVNEAYRTAKTIADQAALRRS